LWQVRLQVSSIETETKPHNNAFIRQKVGICTVRSELMHRRLKWLQALATCPAQHKVLLAVVAGRLVAGSENAFDREGRVTGTAGPFPPPSLDIHACRYILSSGQPCSFVGHSSLSLSVHMGEKHNLREPFQHAVITSQRPFCMSAFKNKRSAQQHARKRGIKGKCPEVSRHPCAGHATEVQPPKQLACPFCAFSTPLPALQKHIASHFDNPGLVSQLQAQPRQRHKGTPVTTLSSFGGSETGRAAVQSDISNCAAWWKLSPEEEAAAVADPYCHSPLVPSDVSECAAWWKLSPEEEEAEIADLHCQSTSATGCFKLCSMVGTWPRGRGC